MTPYPGSDDRIGRWPRRRWAIVVRWLANRLVIRPVLRLSLRITVRMPDELRGDSRLPGPVVLVANHGSHLDAPLILGWLPAGRRRVAVGAAADYFFSSRLRAVLTGLLFNTFPVPRPGRGGRVTTDAARLIDDGWSVLIFPEGTRSPDGSIGVFRFGAAALCVRRDLSCVPIGLHGTHDAMPRGRRWPRRGRPPVLVRFGAPLRPVPGESVAAFNQRVDCAVRNLRTPMT